MKDSQWGRQVGGVHYMKFKIQPSMFIQENKLSWLQGNVIKYVCRYDLKGTPKQDLLKAKHYIDLLIDGLDDLVK